MKKVIFLSLLSLWVMVGVCPGSVHATARESASLKAVASTLNDVGFWIAQHPYPDKTILLSSEVFYHNEKTQQQGLLFDLKKVSAMFTKKALRQMMLELIQSLRHQRFFDRRGLMAGARFFGEYFLPYLKDIPIVNEVQYGLVSQETSQRLLPTEQSLYRKKGDLDFDELQNSYLSLAEPVVVLYTTKNTEWSFVKNRISSGWVRSQDIALFPKDDFLKYLDKQVHNPGVIIAPRASLYADEGMRVFLGSIRMGSLFVLKGSSMRSIEVVFPKKDPSGKAFLSNAFLAREDISIGFLPFTVRSILTQAFKMLHFPYGWGDQDGASDCSRFLQMIFATVGVELPRNSSQQALVGMPLAIFSKNSSLEDKKKVLRQDGVGGVTLLHMPGHVMLYLGTVNQTPYVIHATWSYGDIQTHQEVTHFLKRVVVSDLFLSENTKKGSLLKRLSDIRLIGLPVQRSVLK